MNVLSIALIYTYLYTTFGTCLNNLIDRNFLLVKCVFPLVNSLPTREKAKSEIRNKVVLMPFSLDHKSLPAREAK